MASRIYIVTDRTNDRQRLVRASTPAAARNHVARDALGVQVAGQEALVDLLSEGCKVEDAAQALEPELPA